MSETPFALNEATLGREFQQRCERLEAALRKIMPAMEYAHTWDEDADVPWDDPGEAAGFALTTVHAALEWISREANSEPVPLTVESELFAIRETAQREGWEQSEHYLRSHDRGFVVEVEVRPETP